MTTSPPLPLAVAPGSRGQWAELFSRILAHLLPITYFLVSISFYLRTYDSAQIKITLTQVGCSAVILCWVLQLVFEKRWPFSRKDLPIVAPFLAVLASGVLSQIQSSFPEGSREEFIRRVLYLLMALVVIAEFRGVDRQRRFFRWLLASFGVTVLYGFIQYFDGRLFPPGAGAVGLDPFLWRQAFGWRVFSSFGNPNFYGNFLVIITPILLAFYFRSGGRLFRPFMLVGVLIPVIVLTDKLLLNQFGGTTVTSRPWYWVGLVVGLMAVGAMVWWKNRSAVASGMLIFFAATFINLYATETKGAWLGLVGALVGTAILVGLFLLGPRARRATAGLLGAAVLMMLIGASVVGYYAHRRRQSVDFRVFTWIATWDMIREQPFLGTGIGSFKWAYPAYRRPEIILLEGRSNTETDHAEDEYLEVWHDEGVLGLGALLWLIVTVSVLGLRALRRGTAAGPRAPPAHPFDDRVYHLVAFLGSWWAALLHWFVDVSIRFVSSGIFSFVLPALVVNQATLGSPFRQDAPSPWDRPIRWGIWLFWTAVFLHNVFGIVSLRAAFWPHLLGTLLIAAIGAALGEILEWRLSSEKTVGPTNPALLTQRVSPLTWAVALGAAGLWVTTYREFRHNFVADVHHNVGIFFSKQGLWTKSPEFESRLSAPGYPEPMRREYELAGGALEHYESVGQLRPDFPMARYFIGNVYNDWSSSAFERARDARSRNDPAAESLRAEALALWDHSLKAYDKVKSFAPNYVQTHHQVGLLYLKRMELDIFWGHSEDAKRWGDLALENFRLYNQLDPVFPQNYYRASYIHFTRQEYDQAEQAYLSALKYNTQNAVGRLYSDRNVETYSNLGRLTYILLVNRNPKAKVLPAGSQEFKKAESYFLSALAEAQRGGAPEDLALEPSKSLATLYARSGQEDKARNLWMGLRTSHPKDPDVMRVFGVVPAGSP